MSTFPRFSSGCLPIYAKKLLRWTHRDTSPGGKLGFKWAIPSSSEMLGWLRVRQVAISRLSRCFLSSWSAFFRVGVKLYKTYLLCLFLFGRSASELLDDDLFLPDESFLDERKIQDRFWRSKYEVSHLYYLPNGRSLDIHFHLLHHLWNGGILGPFVHWVWYPTNMYSSVNVRKRFSATQTRSERSAVSWSTVIRGGWGKDEDAGR
jgi:hypothetical protein